MDFIEWGGGKGADAPFNTEITIGGVSRNTVGKKKRKRTNLEKPVRVGGWIEAEDGLWEWKPP